MVWLPHLKKASDEILTNRRRYLKAAGVAAIGGIGFGSIDGAAAGGSYRTVTVPAGSRKSFTLRSGDSLENVLIDVTAPKADAHINASGDNWVIRNVAFKGKVDIGRETGGYSNLMEVKGNGLVENVYMGDGIAWGIRKGAIGSPASHSGHIDFKRVYFAEFSGNGVYAAGCGRVNPPGITDGGGGTYTFDTVYARDNNIAHFRIASNGTKLVNTTITNTNKVPPAPLTAAGQSGVVNSRGVYTGYGDPSQHIPIWNCNIDLTAANTEKDASRYQSVAESALVSGHHSTYGQLTNLDVYDSQIKGQLKGSHVNLISGNGNNPDVSVQAGVPTTPEQAAGGSSNSTKATSHVLSISGGGPGNVLNYTFTVSGTLKKSSAHNATIDSTDTISGTFANGTVADSTDSYVYTGDVTAFQIDNGATVTIDGKTVDPATLG